MSIDKSFDYDEKFNISLKDERHFVMVYEDFLDSEIYTKSEKYLYICLKRFLTWGKSKGEVYPSIKTLASYSGYSERQTIRILKSLCEKGAVLKIRRGLTKSNEYILNDSPEVWNPNLQKELDEKALEKEEEVAELQRLAKKHGFKLIKEEKEIKKAATKPKENKEKEINAISEKEFKKQIQYDEIIKEIPEEKLLVDELVAIVLEASQKEYTFINNESKPTNKFKELNKSMIINVINKFIKKDGSEIKNPRGYILSMLYNQPGQNILESYKHKPEEKSSKPKNSFHNFEQRVYDYDNLEEHLLNRDRKDD